MADCELLSTCIFFSGKMENMPKTTDILKKKYCTGDNTSCARHMVFVACGRAKVPAYLFPGMDEIAKDIIGGKK